MNHAANRRILLVDDTASIHADFRKILVRRPTSPGLDATETALTGHIAAAAGERFELDSAHQGSEGAAMVAAALQAGRPYALAFVDMRMAPGWDGVQTIEQIWRIDPAVQVVICTAYTDHPWDEVMARLDVRDRLLVVKKPFDMIEVSQLAHTLTAKWDATLQAASRIESLDSALEQLRATESALRQSHAELETFVHSLAHDLRAPLTALGSFTQLLGSQLRDSVTGKARHFLSRIQANAAIANDMIDGLLELDRIARARLRPEPIELGTLSRRLLEQFQDAEPDREVSISVHDDLWVRADRELAGVALHHLLDNAWKFSSRETPTHIEVGGHEDESGERAFFVRDNGGGFDMSYADKLFRTFQRLHTDSAMKGTGVGLVTVSRIVSRHGGRVWADSRPGDGATFYFTLPAATPA